MKPPLSDAQANVAARVLREEEAARTHLVVALSGAHAYGFPSPDSDLDIKGIHVDATRAVIGLRSSPPHAERMETIDGVEIDYTSNEIKPVLLGVLQGNGNYLERILGPYLMAESKELPELADITQRSISKRLHRHYLGFATSQLHALEEAEARTIKKVLYVLRTALTGAHALASGTIVTDLGALSGEYGFDDARALIERKEAGERTVLEDQEAMQWTTRVHAALAVLDKALAKSTLPDEPPNADEIEAWLLALRRARF